MISVPVSTTARRVSVADLVVLAGAGALAALAVAYVKLGLRIPGHSIVLAALPMAAGLALAPRRFSGTAMSASALGATWLTSLGGANFGSGATTSLLLLGPMVDVALLRGRRGWWQYGALVLAGFGTSVLALGSRAMPKILGIDVPDGRPFDDWWTQAIVTYSLSGVLAGVLFALAWFQAARRAELPPA
jgi:hypothetical protein